MKKSINCFLGKPGDISFGFSGLLLFCCIMFLLHGCSGNMLEPLADDDSNEAKIEEARMALNDEDYEKAESILSNMSQNSLKVRQYLGSALAGMGNLDIFNLLESIEDINDADDSGSIDLIGKIIDDDGVLNSEELNNKIDNFGDAISAMLGKYVKKDASPAGIVMALDISLDDIATELEDLTSDMSVQLGILGLNHAVLTIAKILMENKGFDSVTLTEKWIKEHFSDNDVWILKDSENMDALLQDISIDLNLLAGSVEELTKLMGADSEETNEIMENFQEFLDELGTQDTDGNYTLTKEELEAYINSL